jgi:hypothetical protein
MIIIHKRVGGDAGILAAGSGFRFMPERERAVSGGAGASVDAGVFPEQPA